MALQQYIDMLEQRLEDLLLTTTQLHDDNEQLRQRLQVVMAECTHLKQKNDAASEQIESIIKQIKQQFSNTQRGDGTT